MIPIPNTVRFIDFIRWLTVSTYRGDNILYLFIIIYYNVSMWNQCKQINKVFLLWDVLKK